MDVFEQFDLFTRALIASKDDDPTYPVVKKIIEIEQFQPQWFVFSYVAFYNLNSAVKFCRYFPTVKSYDSEVFNHLRSTELTHFGHERRGTQRTFSNLNKMFLYLQNNLLQITQLSKTQNNQQFRDTLKTVPNHGSWAAFKIAELFEKSLGCENLRILDLGIDDRDPNSNDGPIGGLRWLFGRDFSYDKEMFEVWNNFGSKLSFAYGVDIGQIETSLCKFHKIMTGKYYVGHDIDELADLRELFTPIQFDKLMLPFPVCYVHTDGVRKHLKNKLLTEGKLVDLEFGYKIPQEKVDVRKIALQSLTLQKHGK